MISKWFFEMYPLWLTMYLNGTFDHSLTICVCIHWCRCRCLFVSISVDVWNHGVLYDPMHKFQQGEDSPGDFMGLQHFIQRSQLKSYGWIIVIIIVIIIIVIIVIISYE